MFVSQLVHVVLQTLSHPGKQLAVPLRPQQSSSPSPDSKHAVLCWATAPPQRAGQAFGVVTQIALERTTSNYSNFLTIAFQNAELWLLYLHPDPPVGRLVRHADTGARFPTKFLSSAFFTTVETSATCVLTLCKQMQFGRIVKHGLLHMRAICQISLALIPAHCTPTFCGGDPARSKLMSAQRAHLAGTFGTDMWKSVTIVSD